MASNKKSKILVVLESPNKVSKIQEYLGTGYIVTSSRGHIRDLDAKHLSIEIDDDFKPIYIVNPDKKHVVSQLKSQYKSCSGVLLATDYDREGESIAWHIAEILKIPKDKRKRMLFTEITKKTIKQAANNSSLLDVNLFLAQQTRRVVDRLIGYKWLSPLLWAHIQNSFKKGKSLSGGRVQSVVNKLIIEREEEIQKFSTETYFKTTGKFAETDMELNHKFKSDSGIDGFCEILLDANFKIDEIIDKQSKRTPSPPFITSSLQQEASNKFNMSPKTTMSCAQRLYENGMITYMRTDSVTLSTEILDIIKIKIVADYGKKYLNIKQYKNKSKNSQEAHEAIRPSDINTFSIKRDDSHKLCDGCVKLYNLIWRRTIASQMSPATINIHTVGVSIVDKTDKTKLLSNYKFISKYEDILFEGFMKVYTPWKVVDADIEDTNSDSSSDKHKKKTRPVFEKDTFIKLNKTVFEEKITKPPHGRYTEASLVKKLDQLGIGRPSTYSSMVSVVQEREYVVKKDIDGPLCKFKTLRFNLDTTEIEEETISKITNNEKNKLVPTEIGTIVNTFLNKKMPEIMDVGFTINLETMLDDIAIGKQQYHSVIKLIYDKFNPSFCSIINESNPEKNKYARVIGKDPYTNLEITSYIAKYGPVVCLKAAASDTTQKDKFVSLKDTEYKIETITLAEASELLKYPQEIGLFKNKPVILSTGRYGLYLKYDNKNWTLKGREPPETIEDIVEYFDSVQTKTKAGDNSGNSATTQLIKKFSNNLQIKNGKWGPYIIYKKTDISNAIFINIGKNNPQKITKEECLELIKNYKPKPKYSKYTTNTTNTTN